MDEMQQIVIGLEHSVAGSGKRCIDRLEDGSASWECPARLSMLPGIGV